MNEFIDKVFLLDIASIKDGYGIYSAVMPYLNEIVNLFTQTLLRPFLKITLYFQNPINMYQKIVNSICLLLAVSGIVANSTNYAIKYDKYKGLLVGILYTFFSFVIPNLFLHKILSPFNNYFIKLVIGFLIFYFLDVIIHFIIYLHTKYIQKDKNKKEK